MNLVIDTLVYESKFSQPECGIPEVTLKSVSSLSFNDKNYPTMEREL